MDRYSGLIKIKIAFDTETYEYDRDTGRYRPVLDANKVVLTCIYDDKGKEIYFEDKKEPYRYVRDLKDDLERHNKRLFAYGFHTEYDWYGICPKNKLICEEHNYICSNPFLLKFGSNSYICDAMSFYRMSLETAGELIGMRKMAMPENPETIDDIKPYCINDCKITLALINRIKELMSNIGFRPRKFLTAGQVAMTSFMTYCRKNKLIDGLMEFNKNGMRIIPSNNLLDVRQAYRGGWNQAFMIGKYEDCTVYDICGAYGDAMRQMDFPDLRTEKRIGNPSEGEYMGFINKTIGVARCTVESPDHRLMYLPIRYGKHVLRPRNCEMKGTWTFFELRKALKLGYRILEVEWLVSWNKLDKNPFKGFVDHLEKLELGDPNNKEPVKLIRNNICGKFSQSRYQRDMKQVHRSESMNYAREGYSVISVFGENYIMQKYKEPYIANYVNPIISAMITAYTRDAIYDKLKAIPWDCRLYTDTDSVITKGNFDHLFNMDKGYGNWKVVTRGTCKILGEKRYYVNNITKLAGVPKRLIDKDKIEKEEDIEIQKMFGLAEGLKKNDSDIVGQFKTQLYEMKPHSSSEILYPKKIDETRRIK